MSTVRWPLTLAVAAALVAAAGGARAQDDEARSMIRSDTFDLDAALQRVALRLFPPKQPGVPYQIEMERRTELFAEGFEVETYVVKSGYLPAGRFVRLKLVADSSTRVDLALLLKDGRVTRAEPLRVPIVEGRPVPDLARCLAPFAEVEAASVAGGMAALFRSLTFVERVAANGPSGPRLTEAEGRALSQAFFDALPKPGPTCPEFRMSAIDGTALDRATFAGKPLLLFFGTVTDQDSRDMQQAVYRFAAAAGNQVALVTVLLDRMTYLDAYRARGGTLQGRTVLDQNEEQKEAFKIPSVPYAVGYDGAGNLKLSILHRDAATTAAELARFKAAVATKGK